MEPLSDQELIQEVREGKRRAYTELMHRYQERVYWVARRIVGGHEDADDVTQETFVKHILRSVSFAGTQVSSPGCTGSRSTSRSIPYASVRC